LTTAITMTQCRVLIFVLLSLLTASPPGHGQTAAPAAPAEIAGEAVDATDRALDRQITLDLPFGTEVSAYSAALEPEFPIKALDTIDLIESGHYGDAADASTVLCADVPDSSIARQLRATVEIWLGDSKRAEEDFRAAEKVAPGEAVTHFGLALCALVRRTTGAGEELTAAAACPNVTDDEAANIATVRAYMQFAAGSDGAARALATPATGPRTMPWANGETPRWGWDSRGADSALRELLAVYAAHTDPGQGAAALSRFLATASGVPQVREDSGLLLTFSQRPGLLASSITDPSLVAMYARRIAQPRMADPAETGDAASPETLSGTVALAPAQQISAITTAVRYTIDGTTPETVSARPYRLAWNTQLVLNGLHTIRIEALMGDDGSVVDRESHTVLVANPVDAIIGTNAGNMAAEDYMRIEQTLWSLLMPRPSRAVAQSILGRLDAKAGRQSDAFMHNLVATALDPAFAARMHITVQRVDGGATHARNYVAANDEVWRGSPSSRCIALTFDDGPNAKTAALIDALNAAHVRATFFVVGMRAEAVPDVIRRMVACGYEVENHSYTHPNIAQCPPSMVESEILRTNVIIRSLTGRYPRFFRPPGGNASETLARLADVYGLRLAFWTVDGLKAEDAASVPGLVKFILGRAKPGAIVLMHNGPNVTTRAVPQIVAGLRARGYRLVTLQELVGK